MYKIVRREQFSDNNFLWEVEAPDVAASAQPGQFVMRKISPAGKSRIKHRACMPLGEDKTVALLPLGVLRVEPQDFEEQGRHNIGNGQRRAWVSILCPIHRIHHIAAQ